MVMELLAGKDAAMDKALLDAYTPKFASGDLHAADLKNVFTLLGLVCNASEDISYEMRGMTQSFQFNIDDQIYTVVFADGCCEIFRGAPEKPTVIFTISSDTVLQIITGNIHSSVAQMNGDITYTGPRHEALDFQRIFEMFLDEFV